MSFPQFITSLALSVAFAGLTIWSALAVRTNADIVAQQSRMQQSIEKAQMQQKVLERMLQRIAVVGTESRDEELLGLLKKYGLTVQTNAPAQAPAN